MKASKRDFSVTKEDRENLAFFDQLPPAVRARMATVEQTATANAARAQKAQEPLIPRLQAELRRIQGNGIPQRQKVVALHKVADEFCKPIADVAACRRGCAHCCHIPVSISQSEADLIGSRVGRVARRPKASSMRTTYGYDQPCPFLVNNECSIYDHRPLMCRLHFNLDADELLCRLVPGAEIPVPGADTTPLQLAFGEACVDEVLADIRDFFPPTKQAG